MSNIYFKTALTTGLAGSLDEIDGSILSDGDGAIVITSIGVYFYYLDDSSGAVESSPDIISPNLNASDKRWLIQYSATISDFILTLLDDASASDFLTTLGITDFVKTILNDADASTVLSTLGVSTFVKTLIDDADAAAVRTTIGAVSSSDEVLLPRSYLAGCGLSNDTDSDHDILVAVGSAIDSTNTYNLTLATAMAKQIDATWAAGDDAGGLFDDGEPAERVVANSTWYHVFLIRKDSDGTIDAGFDTSLTAANIPAGYTYYRRIGSVLTDGSANILAFTQIGDTVIYTAPITDFSDTTFDITTASLKTLSVPLGIKIEAMVRIGLLDEDDTVLISSPDTTNVAVVDATASISGVDNATSTIQEMRVFTNTSSQIRARSESANVNWLQIVTLGYVDKRGRDD